MKQYKLTSADFVTPGESGDPDAYMDPVDLANLKAVANPIVSKIMQNVIEEVPAKVLRERKYE